MKNNFLAHKNCIISKYVKARFFKFRKKKWLGKWSFEKTENIAMLMMMMILEMKDQEDTILTFL